MYLYDKTILSQYDCSVYSTAEKIKRDITGDYATKIEHWKPSLLFKVETKLEKPSCYFMYKALSNFLLNKTHTSQSFCTSMYSRTFCPYVFPGHKFLSH